MRAESRQRGVLGIGGLVDMWTSPQKPGDLELS